MSDRNNTIFGWVLGAGIVALGFTSLSSMYFRSERPEEMAYPIEGAGSGGAAEGPAIETLLATADVAKGEQLFAKCAACHTITPGGPAGIGPNLHGAFGSAIASRGFAYSEGLKAHGGTWDWTNMNAWLTSPRRFADGTKMSFAGLSSAEDRANIMVYLNSQGANMPLPAAPAADAAPADAAAPAVGAAAPADAAATPAAAAPAAP